MINEKGELVMELMYEKKSELKRGSIYDVKLGKGEIKKGLYIKRKRNGPHEIFVESSLRDKINVPRIYSFKDYSFEGNFLHIPSPSSPRIFWKGSPGVEYLLSKLNENLK